MNLIMPELDQARTLLKSYQPAAILYEKVASRTFEEKWSRWHLRALKF